MRFHDTMQPSPVATGAVRAELDRELFHDGNPQPTVTLPRQATDFSGIARLTGVAQRGSVELDAECSCMTRCVCPVATGAVRAELDRELFHDGNPQPTMTLPRQATDFPALRV